MKSCREKEEAGGSRRGRPAQETSCGSVLDVAVVEVGAVWLVVDGAVTAAGQPGPVGVRGGGVADCASPGLAGVARRSVRYGDINSNEQKTDSGRGST